MNARTILIIAAVLFGAVFLGRPVLSDDKGPDKAGAKMPSPEEMKAMMEGMKKWMEAMNPGKNHAALAPYVGSWNTIMKIYWAGPGSEAMEAKGSSEIRWVLGKRYLLEEYKGETIMPDASGQMSKVPYEGMGFTGYDNLRNMYEGNWASTSQTNLLNMKGMADPSGQTITFYGEMDEPMMNVYGRAVKYVRRIINEDKFAFEIYDLHAGENYKVVEAVYTRK